SKAPMAVKTMPSLDSLQSIRPALPKCQVALPEPKVACSLLVPKASPGAIPTLSSTGSVIKPPPPAIESTNPAQSPVRNRTGKTHQANMGGIFRNSRRKAKENGRNEMCDAFFLFRQPLSSGY